MDSEANLQLKQERSRTRWTASLDKIFADLVISRIQRGNRQNNVFDKKTWNHIRDEFNKRTDLNFNSNELKKHLDVLRTRFYDIKSEHYEKDLTIDDSYSIGFDLWEEHGIDCFPFAQHRPEIIKVKDSPIHEQLCIIFTESAADGKYTQSSHYERLEKSAGTSRSVINTRPDGGTLSSENPITKTKQGNLLSSGKMMKDVLEREKATIRCTSFHRSKQHGTRNPSDYGRSLVRDVSSFPSEDS